MGGVGRTRHGALRLLRTEASAVERCMFDHLVLSVYRFRLFLLSKECQVPGFQCLAGPECLMLRARSGCLGGSWVGEGRECPLRIQPH